MNLSALTKHGHFTKVFDPQKRIPESTMAGLLDLLHSSPSSVNCQPWHFVVAANEAGKSRILKSVQGPFELNAESRGAKVTLNLPSRRIMSESIQI